MILILSTFENREEARKIGRKLLNEKLIACYSITPIESAYWWKGKVEETNEVLMIMKTSKKFADVEKFIIEHHSYEAPEIIAIKPSEVTEKYLKWTKLI